jgi:1-acyl-sn-glycerol-3-phosphate acyltransferase
MSQNLSEQERERRAYKFRRLISFLMRHLTRTEFIGGENVPVRGGVLLATNHMSRMDIPALFITPSRPEMTALVTTKYLKYPLLRWFIITANGIWLDRDTADFSAFRKAVEALRAGKALGIAPEGTRSVTASLLEGKPGTALLALRAGVPIVPVAIIGTEDAVPKLLHFKRPSIQVKFGPVIPAPVLDRGNREGQLDLLTTEIMCRIAVMMPEKYHGFYTNHPRLKELQAEEAKYNPSR